MICEITCEITCGHMCDQSEIVFKTSGGITCESTCEITYDTTSWTTYGITCEFFVRSLAKSGQDVPEFQRGSHCLPNAFVSPFLMFVSARVNAKPTAISNATQRQANAMTRWNLPTQANGNPMQSAAQDWTTTSLEIEVVWAGGGGLSDVSHVPAALTRCSASHIFVHMDQPTVRTSCIGEAFLSTWIKQL